MSDKIPLGGGAAAADAAAYATASLTLLGGVQECSSSGCRFGFLRQAVDKVGRRAGHLSAQPKLSNYSAPSSSP